MRKNKEIHKKDHEINEETKKIDKKNKEIHKKDYEINKENKKIDKKK